MTCCSGLSRAHALSLSLQWNFSPGHQTDINYGMSEIRREGMFAPGSLKGQL